MNSKCVSVFFESDYNIETLDIKIEELKAPDSEAINGLLQYLTLQLCIITINKNKAIPEHFLSTKVFRINQDYAS